MKIQNVSFNGAYREYVVRRDKDKKVDYELKQSRPFLRQVAYSMPKGKDLFIKSGKDENGENCLQAYCVENHSKTKPLAKSYGTEFTMGLSFTEKVLKGIKNCYPEEYPYVVMKLVTKLSNIDMEKVNSAHLSDENADLFNKIYPEETD